MPEIKITTRINAPIERCFDLARDVSFYYDSLNKPTEIPVGGKIAGLVQPHDIITWETNHLGFVQHLTLKVSKFEKPYIFVDEMIDGRFKSYRHIHEFKSEPEATVMTDTFYFESPFGIIGRLLDQIFFKHHFKKLIKNRNLTLKQKAESST